MGGGGGGGPSLPKVGGGGGGFGLPAGGLDQLFTAPSAGGGGGVGGDLFGAGGGLLGGALGKTDPWNIFHKKDQVDTTAATMSDIKGMLPQFKSALGADGQLGSQFMAQAGPGVQAGTVTSGQLDMKALASDPRALDAMRERALAKGDSPWLKMATEKQRGEELGLRDQAANQAMSGAAMANSNLAMRGGLTGGAAARNAMGMARNTNAARQQIGRAGATDRLNLGIADDQTKTALLGQTAGLDLATAGQKQDMSKFNIGSKLSADTTNAGMALDAGKFNSAQTYDANKFNAGQNYNALGDENKFNAYNAGEQMKAYGSSKTADATVNAGKK